jgi:hypothetical protein
MGRKEMKVTGVVEMPTKNPCITFMTSPEMHRQITEFWHKNRMKSQSQGVVALIELGLIHVGELGDFRIGISNEEQKILDMYNSASPQMQRIAESVLTAQINHEEVKDIRTQVNEQTKKDPDA